MGTKSVAEEKQERPALDDMAPIERVSVAEQVARNLLDLIRTGSVRPGQQLPTERELAATLQVSRPSVREAVRGLQILGVLKARQGGGLFVTSLKAAEILAPLQMLITLSADNFEALHESRVVVEGAIGRLLAQKITAATIARLRKMIEIQRGLTGNPVAFRVSDIEFHRTLGAGLDNPFLERISESLYVLGFEYRKIAWETPGVLARSVKDHEEIVAALEAKDSERTAAAMVRHMRSVHDTTKAAMTKKGKHNG
ncbi:FadR family transcriptional regulator [Nordella sp. HKS 07]|uniref:FadR/GntR family transcriptional regulator n=1 Tax=Nordella sp. HKS 07 TaxID=2712222 RepID=UPI0013E19F97|nr:FadR/GntR family transcriptional regulator [Nordella sp. HKS 07]QIG47379.1 FadR family transcriptional regulator [Nordella sp. HKS 07]